MEKSNEEIIRLIQENKAAGNTRTVRELYTELIEKNTLLIESIVNKFNKGSNAKMIKEDLLQEGKIMLWLLTNTYNESIGVKFSTYAYNHLMYRIWNCACNESSLIMMPPNLRKRYEKCIRVADELSELYGGKFIPPDIINEQTMLKKEEYEKMMLYPRITASTNAPVGEEEDAELEEFIADVRAEREFDRIIEEEALEADMRRLLTAREHEVMEYILGIGCEVLNMEEIAKILGISAESVRQAKARAIKKFAQDRGYEVPLMKGR